MTFVQIVPRLPPATDGLGDYALRLAREFQANFGIKSRFIVCDPAWIGKNEVEGFPIERIKDHSASSLRATLVNSKTYSAVLLHYVGYGYARRGAPLWLVDGLETWRRNYNDARLFTMFHEVSASGPFWTSAFWLSSLQKHLAARLARLSDVCLTSMQGYAKIISLLSRNKHNSIATLPVFSNVGEPGQTPLPLKDRRRRLVIFGGRSNRLRVYESALSALSRTCRELAIEEVCDVGPSIGSSLPDINGLPVKQTGEMPATEISRLLSDSVAGFFHYHTAYLAKSTIFAAYSAHRLIPVSAYCQDREADGLEAGKHYWVGNDNEKKISLMGGQQIADHAYSWYQAHKLSEHVKTFAEIIGNGQKLRVI